MSTVVKFAFDKNPDGVFLAGQKVSGNIQLTIKQLKTIRGIFLKIQGFSKVEWEESTGTGDSEKRTTYTGNEVHVVANETLMKNKDNNSFDLKPGEYDFKFDFMLPANSPSSFRGCYGETRYILICRIDRPWKFDNVFKRPFTVIHPMDLTYNPSYLLPVERQMIKSFSEFLFFGNGGSITVKASSPCSGYVPGQNIPVSIYIKNNSDIKTSETNACLIQTIEYRANFPLTCSKYEQRLVTINYFGPLKKCKEKNLQCNLHIPAVAPSSLESCKIIEVSYNVEIQLKTRGLHKNMIFSLPVTIATIPYGNSVSISSASTSCELPTYEEAVALGPAFTRLTDEDKYIEKVDYTPKYPLYNNLNIPTLSLDSSSHDIFLK